MSSSDSTPEQPYLPGKAGASVKIIDKINDSISNNRPFFSFEFFPPKTSTGVQNLYTRIERLSLLEPSFMDFTWGAGGTTADLTLEISSVAQSICASEVMMHLTCTNMSIETIRHALNQAKKAGIRNILALRGDPPHGEEVWTAHDHNLTYASDLVKLIREEYGDYFGIAVAGYPEAHMESNSLEEDIQQLKYKMDCGADFIVTQLFYDVDLFFEWEKKCRAAGITQPIIPGIMPIQSYQGFIRMTTFCKTSVPQEISTALEAIQKDDAAVKAYGVQLGTRMCRQLINNGVPGLHFYTLNLEKSCTEILESLGLIAPASTKLPWQQSQLFRRKNEDVRPIFWSNRPYSYLDRSGNWDNYPNGRWSNSASPAFGDLTDYHLCPARAGKPHERREIWGEAPTAPMDIFKVFEGFVSGTVPRLPWCEGALASESTPLLETLKLLNSRGFLTINSQPRVNAAPSTDCSVGWGPAGGYVYQKAYLEFFVSPANLQKFIDATKDYPSIAYCAINAEGHRQSNYDCDQVVAVTWGVFPNTEILQPTVVDGRTFAVWKDEAFALWTSQWRDIYEPKSVSAELIQTIHDTYYLVNVVDNNYIDGDLFSIFKGIVDQQ